MTDIEKAEEYANKILSDSKYSFIFSKEKVKKYIIKVYLDFLKCCERAYNVGLAEGRKELEQWKQEWQDAQIKASEEGFARTTIQIKYKELEKDNAELSNSVTELTNTKTELENKVTELKAKLERFQCCVNCKSFSNCYNLALLEGKDFDITYKCEKWS